MASLWGNGFPDTPSVKDSGLWNFPKGSASKNPAKGSTVLRGNAGKPTYASTDAQGNPLVDAMLGMLGQGGSAGSAGSYTPGYNGAAARAAANAAYDTQLGNTKKVYGQIGSEVAGRASAIEDGYAQATQTINDDAAARVAADDARNAEADYRNQQTAAALGLNVAPSNDNASDRIRLAGQNAYNQNAQAWTGFNENAEDTALERNTATKDAFAYAGTQSQQQLAVLLQQALDSIAGQEAANPGGWSGGSSGRSSASSDLSILKTLMGYDMDQQELAAKNAEASASSAGPFSGISPAGWQSIAGSYGNVSSLGLGSAQANSLALKSVANDPRTFAQLYSVLNG